MFALQYPHGGRRDSTPTSCSLISSSAPGCVLVRVYLCVGVRVCVCAYLHLLIFKDIFGLLNRSMGGVLVGRDHRFYLTYTVYSHCERLAGVVKGSISSWALLKRAWNLCKLLILMISSLCLYHNFPSNTHFPVNTQRCWGWCSRILNSQPLCSSCFPSVLEQRDCQ